MTDKNKIQLFKNEKIRSVWKEDEEEWYFSIVDVVRVLTDSTDPKQYIKKLRVRDEELNSRWGTICTPTEMIASDGKKYRSQAATVEGLLRIIQSIPSKKAEPFKLWLAKTGKERVDEEIDPELAMARAVEAYRRKGYSDEWINQRMLSIKVRNNLTGEWKKRGVRKGQEFAILTDIISKEWSEMTTREYKNFKGLKKQNLRDNMTDTELILNMLAENTTKEISKVKKPETFKESKDIAKQGGETAKIARKEIEKRVGKPVVTPDNYLEINRKGLE